jgi:hypothetical protein
MFQEMNNMNRLILSLLASLTLSIPAFAQSLAPSDVPGSVLVNVSATAVLAAPLTTLVCDATAASITVTLPDATQVAAGKGLKVMMVKTGSSHTVSLATVAPFGSATAQTINTLSASSFNSSYKLTAPATSLSLVSNGSNWVASAGSL